MDVKSLAKMLVCRLDMVLHTVISEDQTGFIRTVIPSERFLRIIHSPASPNKSEVVDSLDARMPLIE